MPLPTLTASDVRSQTWVRFEAVLRDRLGHLREQNDGDTDPIKTAKTRGQISEVKRLLALSSDSAKQEEGPAIGAFAQGDS